VLLVVFVVLAAAVVPLARGRLSSLLDLRIRSAWLLVVAIALQMLAFVVPGDADWWRVAAHVASFPIALGVVWANREITGLWLIALGAVSNGIAIVANGGVMPASASALRTAGLDASPGGFVNSDVLPDPNLLFLGDVFAVPESWPFANVFSVGDVLIAVGAAITIHAVCGSHLVPARFRRVPPQVVPTADRAPASDPPARP
jgi:hypothetical protein